MDLSVVIVNYHTFDLTRNTINSILKYEYPFSYEIIVVDNASEDNSLSNLKDYFKDSVKFISSKENNGFAAGNNQGLRIASGKYILLLNSDTVVWENTLEKIYNFMENNPFVGACGCRVLLADGTLDKACKRSFPNVKNSFYRLFHIPTNSKEDNYNLDNLPDDGIYEIDCLTGAFIFARKKCLDSVGLLDETFFMYGEDIDLSRRMHKCFKTLYYPDVTIIHHHEAASYKSLEMMFVHIRNIIKYFNKWGWFFDSERRKINKIAIRECCSNR